MGSYRFSTFAFCFVLLTALSAQAQVSVDDAEVIEGNTGETILNFFVTRAPAQKDVVVTFGTNTGSINPATEGEDYEGISSGRLLIPAGVTTMPVPVKVIGDTDLEPDEDFFLHLTEATEVPALNFAAPRSFETATHSVCVTAGDLNNDGSKDLVVANQSANTISLFRNISSQQAIGAIPTTISVANGPFAIAVADIDGDDKNDLIVTKRFGDAVALFRNESTSDNLSFVLAGEITVGDEPVAVVTSDLDSDGRFDLVVANRFDHTISAIRNTSTAGNISFAPRVDLSVTGFPLSIALDDLDGDERPDVAVAQELGGVSIFRNVSSVGALGFETKISVETAVGAGAVAIADFDSDGLGDLAVANGSYLSTMRNISQVGDIEFGSRTDFASGTNSNEVAVADFDGDGKVDVATSNGGSFDLSILRNVTAGSVISFAPKLTLGAAAGPSSIVATDLNGDGKPDLAVAHMANSLWVMRNNSAPGSIDLISANEVTVGLGPRYALIADFDGDGKRDLAASNFQDDSISVLKNQTNGTGLTFAPKVDSATLSGPLELASSDLDADGRPDLVVTNFGANKVSVFRNTSAAGSISFGGRVDYATGAGPFGLLIADLNGDNKPDIVVTNVDSDSISILANSTSSPGSFAFGRSDFAVSNEPTAVAAGDVDGDSKVDLVVANSLNPSGLNSHVSVLRNTANAGGAPSFAPRSDVAVGRGPSSVAVGDLNDDGKNDVVVNDRYDHKLVLLVNGSVPGSVTFLPKVELPTTADPRFVALSDLDGDSKKDLAVAILGNTAVLTYRNLSNAGTLGFGSRTEFGCGRGPFSVAVGDLDGDSKQDIVTANIGGGDVGNTLSVLRGGTDPDTTLTFRDNEATGLIVNDERINKPPIANAGLDRTVRAKSMSFLMGSASDADGTVRSFAWTQLSGPPAKLSNRNHRLAWFSPPPVESPTQLIFRLSVVDNEGAIASDDVTINVSPRIRTGRFFERLLPSSWGGG